MQLSKKNRDKERSLDWEIEGEMGKGAEGEVLMEEEREEEVNWDRYLPHMPIRVLLVEGDDSTRQIIAALLRKCSYKGDLAYALSLVSLFCELVQSETYLIN